MNKPFFSILAVNYNGLKYLAPLLKTLREQTFRDFETILVENASVDGSPEFVKQNYPEVELIEPGKNLGYVLGVNLGLKTVRGEWIVVINNDVELPPDCLAKLAAGIQRNPQYKAFSPFLLKMDWPDLVDSAGDFFYFWGPSGSNEYWPANLPEFQLEKDVPSVSGAASVYHRELLIDRLQGFDEDYWLSNEDIDMGHRCQHLGEKTRYLPEVIIYHKRSPTIGMGSDNYLYWSVRNRWLTRVKNYPLLVLCATLPFTTLLAMVELKSFIKNGKFKVWLRARRDGLKLFPIMIKKRRKILGNSKITTAYFFSLLRSNWLGEKDRYPIPAPKVALDRPAEIVRSTN